MVNEDMAEVEVKEEDTEDRNNSGWKIRCGDPGKSRKNNENKIYRKETLLMKKCLKCQKNTFTFKK